MKSGFDAAALTARDAARFERQIAQAQRSGKPLDAARFAKELAEAQARYAHRVSLRPALIEFPPELPVSQARETLAEAIRAHQVVVICGETGSGKTTQLPKLCLQLGRGSRGLIGHTQPRRLAARSVANRIAQELRTPLGELVGFETRFDRRVSERTLVKLMTDGILLAELSRDRDLLAYDTIIIDEAHERSLNIDFLLGWLKRLAPRRPDLKIIITSATLDPERLSQHFGGAPIHTVSGRTYPVDVFYRDGDAEGDIEEQVADGIGELWGKRPDGDVLVFLPGEREIHDCVRVLGGRFPHAAVLPLYSRLPAAQQDRVFSTGGPPRIVLATNVAETSVTVPGIRYVVDTGTARLSRYNPRTGVQLLQIEPVSQAAANQRAGRCGRVGPGICLRLYGETDFAARPAFTDPEILRSNLAGVILQMASLGLGDVEDFPWVQAPESRHVSEGYRVLQLVGALDEARRLTPLGRQLSRLPLDPRVARIALAGKGQSCQMEIAALAAAMSVQDPHETPPEAQTQARQKHAEWRQPKSDFLTLLALWRRWQQEAAALSHKQQRRWCKAQYVSYLRMEEWEQVYRQLLDFLDLDAKSAPTREPTLDELYVPVHKALLAGLIDHVGVKVPEKTDYSGPRGRRFRIFPGSALAKKAPPWLMHAAIVQTSQVFARSCAAIEPEWLAEVGAHLVKRVLHHPEWNSQRGEVTATEHVSLLGLQLLKRARHYGGEAPREARAIFIREGLVRGEVLGKPEFLKRNLALIESVREKETRLRRPDLLADETHLFAFYDARLPDEICTVAGLKSWLHQQARQPGAATPKALDSLSALRGTATTSSKEVTGPLLMQEADVLRPGANADVEELFPEHIVLAGVPIQLSYEHDPGTDADGVSFHLPLAQLFALPAEAFDWLVPGLLPDKIEALIKTLPQHLRRLCQPAGEYARAIVERSPPQGELLAAICAGFKAMIGVELQPADFSPAKLPAHLKPRLVAEDAQGRAMAEAGTLDALRTLLSGAARTAFNQVAAAQVQTRQWVRETVSDWDFGDLPDSVTLPGGAQAIPALVREGTRVALRLFESADAASTAHADGVRALLLAQLADRVRDIAKTARSKLALALSGTPHTVESLAQALAERAANEALLTGASPRTQADWRLALDRRGQFSQIAYQRLEEISGWLTQAVTLRRALVPLARTHAEAHADAAAQLSSLLGPGFVTDLPPSQWPRVAVWLKALALRLERLPLKPQKDADALRQLAPRVARLPQPFHPARWLIEEWRVALFAQELKAQGAPNADKVDAALRG